MKQDDTKKRDSKYYLRLKVSIDIPKKKMVEYRP